MQNKVLFSISFKKASTVFIKTAGGQNWVIYNLRNFQASHIFPRTKFLSTSKNMVIFLGRDMPHKKNDLIYLEYFWGSIKRQLIND